MKPTLDSIAAADRAIATMREKVIEATTAIWAARRLVETESPKAALVELREARAELITLRRSQTAALENIDEAIATCDGTH